LRAAVQVERALAAGFDCNPARIFDDAIHFDWLELPARSKPTPAADADMIAEAVRHTAARHLPGVSCKERSLTCWALCRMAGIPASVVLGISLFPLILPAGLVGSL
jgi:hypothetical protein